MSIRTITFAVSLTFDTENGGAIDPDYLAGSLDAAVETFGYDGRLGEDYADTVGPAEAVHATFLSCNVTPVPEKL